MFRMYPHIVVLIQKLQTQVFFSIISKRNYPPQMILRRLLKAPLVPGDPSSLCADKIIQQNRIKQIFFLIYREWDGSRSAVVMIRSCRNIVLNHTYENYNSQHHNNFNLSYIVIQPSIRIYVFLRIEVHCVQDIIISCVLVL